MLLLPSTAAAVYDAEAQTPIGQCACGEDVFASDPGWFWHGDDRIECEACCIAEAH